MQPDKRLIVFNGPPGVGKDTAAKHVERLIKDEYKLLRPTPVKMADPLKKAVHALFGLFYEPNYYDNSVEGRRLKEEPNGLCFGRSPRQAYIEFSEQAIKPWLGPDVFGRIAANTIHNQHGSRCFIFSDGGFVDEWRPVIDCVGSGNCLVVELHSASCSWIGDSRSYIGEALKAEYPDIQVARVRNDITKDPFDRELFLMQVAGVVKKFLGDK